MTGTTLVPRHRLWHVEEPGYDTHDTRRTMARGAAER